MIMATINVGRPKLKLEAETADGYRILFRSVLIILIDLIWRKNYFILNK